MMSTIKDVAKMANVSIGTVSKYINGIKIRESNRAAIQKAIESLNYRTNLSAQALKTRHTSLIAILVPDIVSAYSPQVIREIEHELYQLGYTVVIIDSNYDHALERRKIQNLLDRRVDGFIIFPINHLDDNYAYILSCGTPICIVDHLLADLPCAQVLSDNTSATFRATQKLIQEGHLRIGIITGAASNTTAAERMKGYRDALKKAGLAEEDQLQITTGFSEMDGYAGAVRLLSLPEPPTAMLLCNYYTTLGAICALMDKKVDIPRGMRVIGFDYENLPYITRQPMGIITQSIKAIAREAVYSITQQITRRGQTQQATIRIPTEFTDWTLERIAEREKADLHFDP